MMTTSINQYVRRMDTEVDTIIDIDIQKIPSFIAQIYLETMDRDDVHDICLSLYQLRILQWKESMWQLYLQAGTGKLQLGLSNTIYWPSDVINTLYDQRQTVVNDDTCRDYVQQQLKSCQQQRTHVQQRYNAKKKWIYQYDTTMEESIQTKIDQHLQPIRLHYESHFQTIRYNYRLQSLEDRWMQDHPTSNQRKFIVDFLRTKTEYEKIKQELKFYREKSNQIRRVPVTLPISVQSLVNGQLRQEFCQRQSELIEDYQLKMKILFEKILSQRYGELKKLLNDFLLQYTHLQQDIHSTLSLTSTMISTLDQILLLIPEKVIAASQSKQQQSVIELLLG